jgi:hypothetical protein
MFRIRKNGGLFGDHSETFVLIQDRKCLGQQCACQLPKKDSALRNLLLLLLFIIIYYYYY